MRFLWLLVGCLAVAGWVHAELRVWVDEAGITHLSNRAEAGVGFTPTKAVLGDLWEGPLDAAGRSVGSGNGRERERSQRLLRAAVADLQRGETLRAAEVLESILRDRPADAEAHWYLALLERQRGLPGHQPRLQASLQPLPLLQYLPLLERQAGSHCKAVSVGTVPMWAISSLVPNDNTKTTIP